MIHWLLGDTPITALAIGLLWLVLHVWVWRHRYK